MRTYTTKKGDVLDLVCIEMDGHCNLIEEVLSQNPELSKHDYQSLPAGIEIAFADPEVVSNPIADSVSLWD